MSQSYSIIFGLTADPVHLGHEQAIINGVEFCRERGLKIGRFLLVPVYQPNLIVDKKSPVASFDQRFAMCVLVASRLSKQLACDIQVSQIEKQIAQNNGENNYSVNTIRALNNLGTEIPASAGMTGSFLFMVSADHFGGRWPKFRQWFKWQELLNYSGLLINQRPGSHINQSFVRELRQINPSVFIVQNSEVVDVSSSEIRQGFDAKKTVDLLASDVLNYIKEQRLY